MVASTVKIQPYRALPREDCEPNKWMTHLILMIWKGSDDSPKTWLYICMHLIDWMSGLNDHVGMLLMSCNCNDYYRLSFCLEIFWCGLLGIDMRSDLIVLTLLPFLHRFWWYSHILSSWSLRFQCLKRIWSNSWDPGRGKYFCNTDPNGIPCGSRVVWFNVSTSE